MIRATKYGTGQRVNYGDQTIIGREPKKKKKSEANWISGMGWV